MMSDKVATAVLPELEEPFCCAKARQPEPRPEKPVSEPQHPHH